MADSKQLAQAQQAEVLIDGLTPHEFALRELHAFQEATGCDTAQAFAATKAKAEAKPLTDEHIMDIAFELRFYDGAQYLLAIARAIEITCAEAWGVKLAGIGASSGGAASNNALE